MESFIPRIGGKRLLRKQILARFPSENQRYVEVFGGAGWLLFSRERHAPEEICNDIDGELVNLFRCVKFHCEELQLQMAWMLNSREIFEDALALKAVRGLTDIQRAALYFIVAKESYGADGRTLEAVGEVFPEAKYQRCTVHFYRNVFSVTPRSKVKLVAKMLKAIHAQESKKAAREKAKAVCRITIHVGQMNKKG